MDARKASLVREFLLQKPVEEWFADEILHCLPVPHLLHPHLKKAILLRRLSSEISAALLSHDTLQCLELLEEVDRSLGGGAAAAPPSPALAAAYCAVAAELTVAPLRRPGGAEADAGFLEAAHWIWDCRVADLERSEARGMVGEGLREWRAAIKGAVVNAAAREALLRRDTRSEAAEAVREYLRVALDGMGPALLELVARAAGAEEEYAGGTKEDDAGGGSGERVALEGPSGMCLEGGVSTGVPAEVLVQMGHLPLETVTDGSPHVSVTETNEKDELAGQTGEVITDQTSGRLTVPSSVEVNKVREALKSSCQELRKVVVDPLPDALERAADVQISMGERSASPSDACGNPNQMGSSEPGPSVQTDAQDTVTENTADEDHNVIPCPSVPDHDVMDITARTYEGGEDSNECPSGKSANYSRRTRLSTRNRKLLSPMLQEVSKFVRRRKIKRWTPQEEDALREAVKKHGKGNWKFILQSYPETFEDRTEIDLKDKWRNMTR